jgi:flagellar biosynthetic protein FliQ
MNQDTVVSLLTDAMTLSIKVAAPALIASLVVGLVVSIFQAVTSIHEQTLSFLPKVAAMIVVLIVGGPWMLGQIVTYTQSLYEQIPSLIG